MNANTVLVVVSLLSNSLLANAILCNVGYSVQSEFLNDDQLNIQQCEADQQCLRGDAMINYIVPMELAVGSCVTPTECEWECATLVVEAAAEFFSLTGEPADVRSCQRACCGYDNCNAHRVGVLDNYERPSTRPVALRTTLPATIGASACYSGISNLSTGENTLMLSSLCSSTNSQCLRQETTTMSQSGALVKYIIGACVNQTTCTRSCSSMALEIIGDPSLSTRSCQMACCDFDNCNSLPIDVLSVTTHEDEFISPTPVDIASAKTNNAKVTTTIKSKPSTTTTRQTITTTTRPLVTTTTLQRTTTAKLRTTSTLLPDTSQEKTTSSSLIRPFTTDVVSLSPESAAVPTTLPITSKIRSLPPVTDSPTSAKQTSSPSEIWSLGTSVGQTWSVAPASASLNCAVGSMVILPQSGISAWHSSACPPSKSYGCLRQEILISLDNETTANVTFGSCANQTTCMGTCNDLAMDQDQNHIFQELRDRHFDISSHSFAPCKLTCCHADGCYQNTISNFQYQEMQKTASTRIPETTASLEVLPTTPDTMPRAKSQAIVDTTVASGVTKAKKILTKTTSTKTMLSATKRIEILTTDLKSDSGSRRLSISKCLSAIICLLCISIWNI